MRVAGAVVVGQSLRDRLGPASPAARSEAEQLVGLDSPWRREQAGYLARFLTWAKTEGVHAPFTTDGLLKFAEHARGRGLSSRVIQEVVTLARKYFESDLPIRPRGGKGLTPLPTALTDPWGGEASYYSKRAALIVRGRTPDLAPSTISTRIAHLSLFLQWADRQGLDETSRLTVRDLERFTVEKTMPSRWDNRRPVKRRYLHMVRWTVRRYLQVESSLVPQPPGGAPRLPGSLRTPSKAKDPGRLRCRKGHRWSEVPILYTHGRRICGLCARQRRHENRARLLSRSRCPRHPRRPVAMDRTMCSSCLRKNRDRARAWRILHPGRHSTVGR